MNAYLSEEKTFSPVRITAEIDNYILGLLYVSVAISYCLKLPMAAVFILIYALITPLEKMINVLPIILFFYSYLTIPFINLSVFVPYSFIFILKFIFTSKMPISVFSLAFICVNFIYCIAVMLPLNYIKATTGLLGVLFAFSFSASVKNTDVRKVLFSHYGFSAVLAMFLALIFRSQEMDYMEINGYVSTYFRFLSTFSDPNYAGFFYTVGMWAVIVLKPYKIKFLNVIVAFLLAVAILLTVSITAIVILILTYFLYLLLEKKENLLKTLTVSLIVIATAFALIYYATLKGVPYISDLSTRFLIKSDAFLVGDIGSATTNRTNLFERAWDYFSQSNLFSQLFGGTCSTAIVTDGRVIIHNEYLTLLINIGIVGTIIYLSYCIKMFFSAVKKHDVFDILKKSIVATYAITLTFFMDFRFIFIFLI